MQISIHKNIFRTTYNESAHYRYHPTEWTNMQCRQKMNNERDKNKALKEVFENFTPVFHNYFIENYPNSMEWFQQRLQYSKSVAVNSIVGHIMGIGDRHSMNILIDMKTSELIHIDFGVTFDQGKVLRTPELIPFRLTRDIIDGMGIMGTEGIFRVSCENVLSLLRDNSNLIMTLVEVLIHNPLFNWIIPLNKIQINKDDSIDDEKIPLTKKTIDSSRILLQTQRKLRGIETNDGVSLSVKSQVIQLIADAQKMDNLSKLFPGWGSWI